MKLERPIISPELIMAAKSDYEQKLTTIICKQSAIITHLESKIQKFENEIVVSDADSTDGVYTDVRDSSASGDTNKDAEHTNSERLEKITSDGKYCFESNSFAIDLEDEEVCVCEAGSPCKLKTKQKSE